MSFLTSFLSWLRALLSPEKWLLFISGLGVSTVVAALAWWLAYDAKARWGCQLAVFLSAFIATLAIWAAIRFLYLWWGRDRKIGICFDAYRVSAEDWNRASRELHNLFRSNAVTRRVRLRHIHPSLIATTSDWEKLERRYRFASTFRVTVSPPANGAGPEVIEFSARAAARKALDTQFVKATCQHMAEILGAPPQCKSLVQLLRFRAGTFYEAMILHLAAFDFADSNFADAVVYLSLLDERLAPRYGKDQQPRLAVRWLWSGCLVFPSNYAPENVPEPDELRHATELTAKAAELFPGEFPGVLTQHARNLFFGKRLEEALTVSEQALKLSQDPTERAHCVVNLGVLHLFKAHWSSSANAFERLLQSEKWQAIDFVKLISFADFAREFGEEHAIYVQCLYRVVAKRPVPDVLRVELATWLDEDTSRDKLRYIYNAQCRASALAAGPTEARPTKKGNRPRARKR